MLEYTVRICQHYSTFPPPTLLQHTDAQAVVTIQALEHFLQEYTKIQELKIIVYSLYRKQNCGNQHCNSSSSSTSRDPPTFPLSQITTGIIPDILSCQKHIHNNRNKSKGILSAQELQLKTNRNEEQDTKRGEKKHSR